MDSNLSKPFKVLDPKPVKFICLFHPMYEEASTNFIDLLEKCGEAYGITIEKMKEVRVNSEAIEEWIKAINDNFTKEYNQVICILDNYLKNQCDFYAPLKKHSLEISGYPMQVVLENTINKKSMSVVSNILLQINSKIGGSLLRIDLPKNIKEKNLIVFGIDISCIKRTSTLNVAMCATINPDFTKYTSKKESIKLDNNQNLNNTLCFNISNFITEAIQEYFKLNKYLPGGVIIYRQGVSKEQINCIKSEVQSIEDLLSGKNQTKKSNEIFLNNPIDYNYILVNKKVNMKFFEKENNFGQGKYFNPDSGLLIFNDLVERDSFEFYIQPQCVNSGCATPTCFQVAFGNMDIANELPKITYDLCYMYSNWKGPVRVPAPLKYAEKLAKTEANLNEKSKNKLYHL